MGLTGRCGLAMPSCECRRLVRRIVRSVAWVESARAWTEPSFELFGKRFESDRAILRQRVNVCATGDLRSDRAAIGLVVQIQDAAEYFLGAMFRFSTALIERLYVTQPVTRLNLFRPQTQDIGNRLRRPECPGFDGLDCDTADCGVCLANGLEPAYLALFHGGQPVLVAILIHYTDRTGESIFSALRTIALSTFAPSPFRAWRRSSTGISRQANARESSSIAGQTRRESAGTVPVAGLGCGSKLWCPILCGPSPMKRTSCRVPVDKFFFAKQIPKLPGGVLAVESFDVRKLVHRRDFCRPIRVSLEDPDVFRLDEIQ